MCDGFAPFNAVVRQNVFYCKYDFRSDSDQTRSALLSARVGDGTGYQSRLMTSVPPEIEGAVHCFLSNQVGAFLLSLPQ